MLEYQQNWTSSSPNDQRCIIIGAGPAGLTVAYELSQAGFVPVVLEQDQIVGGIARTVEYAGYRFDIGGHRFFTKVQTVDEWWKKILNDDMLVCSRLSRIYYNKKFFDYPLKPLNAIAGLGPVETFRIAASYMVAQLFPYPVEATFEQWVSNRFGRRLYEIFFKNYTEKVWGMKCSEIGSDWAAQRIKNLDFTALVKNMFLGTKEGEITSLIDKFLYPRLGPGMMWERVAQILTERGFPVRLGCRVTQLHLTEGRLTAVTVVHRDGSEHRIGGEHFISSMPIKELVASLDGEVPTRVSEAAQKLRYRDFLTVGLIINRPNVFSDNWIYIHSPEVKVGRIQNFKNWSPEMSPDQSKTSLGLEYFVQEDDEIWSAKDGDLVELATDECAELGLIDKSDVIDGVVIRMPKAYPVYDASYKQNLSLIRSYLDTIENLQLIGRNGQHRYNNQDHSMLTAICAARNLFGANHDLWEVNVEGEYHEEIRPKQNSGRLVPQTLQVVDALALLQSAFARYDPYALSCALAAVLGLGTLCLISPLLFQDRSPSELLLMRNYLFGFDVTWTGITLGILQTTLLGFLLGFVMAHAINLVTGWNERRLLYKLEKAALYEEPLEPAP
jgi:protoporphyrinogen oxidase